MGRPGVSGRPRPHQPDVPGATEASPGMVPVPAVRATSWSSITAFSARDPFLSRLAIL
jgi:hypothetical protein